MSWWRRLRHRDRLEGELDRELRDHVERQVAEHLRAGLPAGEARRRARLEFGGLDQIKELCRDARGTRWIESISRDLRYAVRHLARDRSLVALAVATLGLGIGLNVTIFTMVHAIFVRGLPYEDPGRMVNVSSGRDPGDVYQRVSLPDFEDYRRGATTLSGLAAFTVDSRMSLSGGEHGPQPRNGSIVTPNTFGLLGQPVLLGRDFRTADGRRGADGTVILGYHVWRDRYGGNPDVIGRIVRVDGEPSTVIGVMPEGVRFPFRAEFWQALRPTEVLDRRDVRALATVGRLRPGAAIEEARAEARAVAERLRSRHPATNEDIRATVQSFNDWATGANVRLIYLTLAGAVAFVLLIACANVANLLIARSAQRAHEFAIRFTQGATRWRVVRQLSVESLVLGGAGGLAGLAVAAGGVRLAEVLTRDMGMPPWMVFTIDPPVVAFFFGLCIVTTLLFGLAPLLHVARQSSPRGSAWRPTNPTGVRPVLRRRLLARTPIAGLLQEGGRSGTQSVRARRLSSAMLVVEATLALVLLGGTGLMLRSLDKLYRIDLGFDLDRVLYGEVTLPSARYSEPEERVRFVTRLEDRLNASRGVRAASVVINRSTAMLEQAGRPAAEEPRAEVLVLGVGPRYFDSLDARILRGRALTRDDGRPGSEAAVVNARLAELFLDGDDALGRRIRVRTPGEPVGPWLTIVGIGSNIHSGDLRRRDPPPAVHVPYRMAPGRGLGLQVLTESAPAAFAPRLRAAVRALDPDLPVYRAQSMTVLLEDTRWWFVVLSGALGVFAGFAVVLATVGVYAVTACSVAQRTREIGIRMALGALPHQIAWSAVGRVLAHVGAGLLLGVAGALAAGRVIESLLFQVSPVDPLTLGAVPLVFAALVAAACAGPVRRALSLDPSAVLRLD